jgi:hypothetical protein
LVASMQKVMDLLAESASIGKYGLLLMVMSRRGMFYIIFAE